MHMKYCFGIDIGGTTVKMGLFSEEEHLIDKWEIPTNTENKEHSPSLKLFYSMVNALGYDLQIVKEGNLPINTYLHTDNCDAKINISGPQEQLKMIEAKYQIGLSSKFDIYVVPIKFNQKYTIGVTYDKVEVCAALYDYDNFTLLTNEEDTITYISVVWRCNSICQSA